MLSNENHKILTELKSKRKFLPRHVAIIMDGNGRWAASRFRPRIWGHSKGVDSVRAVVEASGELGLEALTLFAFSEENWGRPRSEVSGIMKLLDTYLQKEKAALKDNNIQFRVIGDISQLPEQTRSRIEQAVDDLKGNTGLILNIAISYGGRSEIVAACKQLVEEAEAGQLKSEDVTQEMFAQHLFTSELPDPDLVIRTSGELRVSNFLLWQIAYSEFYFSPLNWPDFRKPQFFIAIKDFLDRKRRFGLVEVNQEKHMQTSEITDELASEVSKH
jgi:undecaprenyl diphosphate synthase